jgi:hypothetical protein
MAKLEGSTIIETIVATLIISICFEIAIIGISKLYVSNRTSDIINANSVADNIISIIIEEKDFTNRAFEKNNYLIKQEISAYKNISDLKLIKIEVTNNFNFTFNKYRVIHTDQ